MLYLFYSFPFLIRCPLSFAFFLYLFVYIRAKENEERKKAEGLEKGQQAIGKGKRKRRNRKREKRKTMIICLTKSLSSSLSFSSLVSLLSLIIPSPCFPHQQLIHPGHMCTAAASLASPLGAHTTSGISSVRAARADAQSVLVTDAR